MVIPKHRTGFNCRESNTATDSSTLFLGIFLFVFRVFFVFGFFFFLYASKNKEPIGAEVKENNKC